MRNKTLRSVPALVLIVILAVAGVVTIYAGDYYRADETAIEAWKTNEMVEVFQMSQNQQVFYPKSPEAGLIFYPGGKVEFSAYAPLMQEFAARGILCIVVKMPLNLAVLDVDAAGGVAEAFPEITKWYIGGHSLGGSMAASYAADNPDKFDGLILLAAYSTADLTETGLQVISIYGSADEVINREKYEQYRDNLPESTVEVVIEGGNHGAFGSYGHQEGDGKLLIEPSAQRTITADQLEKIIKEQ